MNWIIDKIKKILPGKKKSLEIASDAWTNCPTASCPNIIYKDDLVKFNYICTQCDAHIQMPPHQRLKLLFDDEAFEEIKYPSAFTDPNNFKTDGKVYKEQWNAAREKTGLDGAFLIGSGKIKGIPCTICCQSFAFLGGSVAAAEGEAIIKAAEHAITYNTPLIIYTSSGGMRMQSSAISLMQLPKTTVGISMVKDAKLPVINVLCSPTSGGVLASFGMLADVTLSEPGATLMFSGKRVTAATGEIMDDSVFTAEEYYRNGFIDQIVHRNEQRDNLAQIISILLKRAA